MQDDRLRQPGDADYLLEIGRAIWVFAILEWNAAWCCERLEPIVCQKSPTGLLGASLNKLLKLTEALPASDQRSALAADANHFKELTRLRNRIVHGRPCTHEDKARLSDNQIWTPECLQAAADEFSKCSSKLNAHLHGWLAQLA